MYAREALTTTAAADAVLAVGAAACAVAAGTAAAAATATFFTGIFDDDLCESESETEVSVAHAARCGGPCVESPHCGVVAIFDLRIRRFLNCAVFPPELWCS